MNEETQWSRVHLHNKKQLHNEDKNIQPWKKHAVVEVCKARKQGICKQNMHPSKEATKCWWQKQARKQSCRNHSISYAINETFDNSIQQANIQEIKWRNTNALFCSIGLLVSWLVSQFSEELFETSSLVTNLKMSHFVSWSVSNHLLERANIMKSSKQTQAKWQKCDISNWPSMEKWRTLVIKQWQINLCGQMTQTVKISESNGTALHAFLKICIQLCMTCRFSVKKV